jgi:hypothetical protein
MAQDQLAEILQTSKDQGSMRYFTTSLRLGVDFFFLNRIICYKLRFCCLKTIKLFVYVMRAVSK